MSFYTEKARQALRLVEQEPDPELRADLLSRIEEIQAQAIQADLAAKQKILSGLGIIPTAPLVKQEWRDP